MINIYSPISTLGYAIHGQNIIKALVENGQDINLTTIGEIQADQFFEIYIKEGLKNKSKFNVKDASVFIFHDELSNNACGTPLFTYSIFETSKIKQSSFDMLENGPTNIILTTTKDHKQYLIDQKISKPIEVVHEGIDDTLFNTIPVNKYIDTKKFTYILAGKREERKNTDLTIRLFINLMKEKEVALICHTFNPFINRTQDHPFKNLNCWSGVNPIKHGFEYKGFNGQAHIFTYKTCDLYFTVPTIPVSNMPSLYHSANIGIQVSRGEGWGLPLQELMACGVPCIATDCLGHKEYLTDTIPDIQKNLIINKTGTDIAIDNIWFRGDQGTWDILDIEKFSQILEETYQNQTLYNDKNEQLSEYMSSNYSWSLAAKELIKVIEKYK